MIQRSRGCLTRRLRGTESVLSVAFARSPRSQACVMSSSHGHEKQSHEHGHDGGHEHSQCCEHGHDDHKKEHNHKDKVMLQVNGINCGGCAKSLTEAFDAAQIEVISITTKKDSGTHPNPVVVKAESVAAAVAAFRICPTAPLKAKAALSPLRNACWETLGA